MPKRKRDEEEARLWCVCRRPNDPTKLMLQCDCCEEWYHPECISLQPEEIDSTTEWICEGCSKVLQNNPSLKHTDISRLQGRVVPTTGWSNQILMNEFNDRILQDNIMPKKNQQDGYRLWHASRIQACCSNLLNDALYYKFEVQASMKMQMYAVILCFSTDGRKLRWKNCGCPAGVDGECKHVVASLYALQDYILRQVVVFPEAESKTERRQMWHIKKPAATKDAILFSSRTIEKARPGADKQPLAANVHAYSKKLDMSQYVTRDAITRLAVNLQHLNLPVLHTHAANNYAPIQRKEAHDPAQPVANAIFSQMHQLEISYDFDSTFKTIPPLHQNFCQSLILITWNDAKTIEESTRLQGESPIWKKSRYYRITSSNFKKFCRHRQSTCPVRAYKQINRSRFASIAEQHGKLYEGVAIKKLMEIPDLFPATVVHSAVGLFIHPRLPFLGTSPDYAVLLNERVVLIEVKCPYSLYTNKKSVWTAAADPGFHLTKSSDGNLTMNRESSTYYQIQGQLNLTNSDYALLVVFVPPSDLVYVKVEKDSRFFFRMCGTVGTSVV